MLLTLPNSALKYLDDKIIRIEIDEYLLKQEPNMKAVEKARGILKKHKIDGVDYQNQIREEWERKVEIG